jgi:hypothetical protein
MFYLGKTNLSHMKKYFLKPVILKLIISFVLIIVASVIHSCRKDSKSDPQTSPAITQAKTWYEGTYPVSSAKSKLLAESPGGSHDLTQWIKPDWQHTTSYVSNGKNIIEMPVDPNAKFASAFKIGNKLLNKAYSRSYYLLMNDGKEYEAYILTIIADSGYVKNDLSKLAHNTYRKQDTDFSGLALYFTPKGDYLGGYAYNNGQLVTPTTTQQNGSQTIQNVNNSNLKTNDMAVECTDWFLDYYWGDEFVYSVYTGTTCTSYNSGSGSSGSSHIGSGSSGTPPPPVCAPTPPPPAANATNGSHLTVNFIPPPNPCTPIVPVSQYITNDVHDLCIKSTVQASIDNNIQYRLNESMNAIFNSNANFNIHFTDDVGTTFQDPTVSAITTVDNLTVEQGTTRNIITGMDITIKINNTQLANASKEYITATIIHEAFHAYLRANQTILNEHYDMAQNYLTDMTAELIKMYPNLSPAIAKDLSWGGLEKDSLSLYTDLSSFDKSQIELANTNYRTGQQGTPCTNAQY